MIRFKQILQSEYIKNSLNLISGTFLAQIVPFLVYPVLGRMYSPADFTLLANYTALVTIISVIVSMQYRYAILIARTEKNAINILTLALLLTVIGSLLFTSGLFLFGDKVELLINQPGLTDYFMFIPVSIISINFFDLYNEWCVRHKYFSNLSANKIVNAATVSGVKMLLGFTTVSNGLVYGDATGRFLSALFCYVAMLKKKCGFRHMISIIKLKYVARRYKGCPLNLMPSQLLNTIGGHFPVLILSAFFPANNVGQFTMAYSVIALPSVVVSLAIRDVFRQKANEEFVKTKNCKGIYMSTMKVVALMSLVGFSLVYLISPWLFPFFLGEEWSLSGNYARVLCPMIAINFVSEVGSGMFIIAEKMKESMYWQIAYVLLSLLSLWLSAIIWNDMVATIWCFTIARSVLYLINFRLTYLYSTGKR